MEIYDREIILISNPKVLAVPIRDNNEPLVDLAKTSNLLVDTSRNNVQKISDTISLVRKSVADMLLIAQKHLPPNYKIFVKEGYRDIQTQKKLFNSYRNHLKETSPTWSEEKIYKEASKYVSPPEIIPPHSTGGAVDLTILIDGKEADMGTHFNADPLETNNASYTNAKVSKNIKERRTNLIQAMEVAGFVNYPTEWWHWSYGDRYWALLKRRPFAIYGGIDK